MKISWMLSRYCSHFHKIPVLEVDPVSFLRWWSSSISSEWHSLLWLLSALDLWAIIEIKQKSREIHIPHKTQLDSKSLPNFLKSAWQARMEWPGTQFSFVYYNGNMHMRVLSAMFFLLTGLAVLGGPTTNFIIGYIEWVIVHYLNADGWSKISAFIIIMHQECETKCLLCLGMYIEVWISCKSWRRTICSTLAAHPLPEHSPFRTLTISLEESILLFQFFLYILEGKIILRFFFFFFFSMEEFLRMSCAV